MSYKRRIPHDIVQLAFVHHIIPVYPQGSAFDDTVSYTITGTTFNEQGELLTGAGTITINNQSIATYELPSTGGPGTRLFTILGSILILGAGVLLWRRRRLV